MSTASRGYEAGRQGMTIGGVMGKAFAAIGRAPVQFIGTSFLLVGLPAALLAAMTRVSSPTAAGTSVDFERWIAPMVGGWLVVWLLFYMAAQALLLRVTVTQIKGRPERVGEHARAAIRSWLPLVGLAILLTLAVWMGFMVFVVPGVMLALMWSVAAPALVTERIGVFAAFGRSRYLTSGARWRIFGLVVLAFAVYFTASAMLGLGSMAVHGIAAGAEASGSPSLVATIVSVMLQTAFVAIWTAIQGALFVELRNWKDGPAGEHLASIFA